jgi:hypothetical protein
MILWEISGIVVQHYSVASLEADPLIARVPEKLTHDSEEPKDVQLGP